MERWTFLSRILARFHRVPRQNSSDCREIPLFSSTSRQYEEMLWSKRFGVKTFQPKSLPEINYEEIINGQVEDFSPDCWLDGHIHRFANAADIIPNQNQFQSQEDVSSDSVSSDGFDSNTSSPQIGDSPRNILLDLFSPMYESGPPPYSDEPPPSYEEATSNFLDPNSSNSVGEPHDSDWMW